METYDHEHSFPKAEMPTSSGTVSPLSWPSTYNAIQDADYNTAPPLPVPPSGSTLTWLSTTEASSSEALVISS